MDSTHTPTPWKTCESTPSLIEVNGHIFVQVTEVYDGSTDEERLATMWANAAFIVRACNAFYPMLAALKEAREEDWDGLKCQADCDEMIAGITGTQDSIIRAIELAEGK